MVFFIFSHSGYVTDSIDLEFHKFGFINPNTATYDELSSIPFLSEHEISLILTMRKVKPFVSIHDLAEKVGLFPFETEYLKDILYFGKEYSLKFKFSYDSLLTYSLNYLYSGHSILSIWKTRDKTYFMSSVRTPYITIMQGYITPVFQGGVLQNYSYTPRKSGIKRDTSYNFLLLSRNILFFNTPYSILLKTKIKNIEIKMLSDSTKRHIKGVSTGTKTNSFFIEGGIKDKKPVFYVSLKHTTEPAKVFVDIYSKYTSYYRTYGAHIYSRTQLLPKLNLKIYGAYRYSYNGAGMRTSTTLQYKEPLKRFHLNVGIKKLYSSNTRIYSSVGVWGKTYMYFSLTKELNSPSYMLRYSAGFSNFSIQYLLSSNDADYVFLDSGTGTYFMGKIREKFKLRYRIRIKELTFKAEYETGDTKVIRLTLSGRIYH